MKAVIGGISTRLRSIQSRLGPFWWHSAIMFVASRISDVLHIAVGLFLVPMFVPEEQLGAVLPLLQLGAFFGVPLKAAAKTTARYVTSFRVSNELGRIKSILRDLLFLSLAVSFLGTVTVLAGQSFFAARLHFEGAAIPLLVGGLIVVSCWRPVLNLANQGLGHYYRITGSVVISGLIRVLLAIVLLPLFGLEGFLAMQLVGGLIVCAFLVYGFRSYFNYKVVAVSNREMLREVSGYFCLVLLTTAILSFQAMMEPWIIRHRLPEMDSAAYYVTSRFGMIPAYIGSALMPFLFPMVSEQHDKTESTRRLHVQVIAAVAVFGVFVTILFALIGPWLLNQFTAWRSYVGYSDLMWKTAFIALGQSVIMIYSLHETACRRFGFLWFLVPVVFLEISGLYGLMGWSFFHGMVPEAFWQTVDEFVIRDISFIISFMIFARVIVIAGILIKELLSADGAFTSKKTGVDHDTVVSTVCCRQ